MGKTAQCIPQIMLWGFQCPQVTKNYTLNLHCHFAFDWMLLTHLDNKSKERFYNQTARESKCMRVKTVDKDILITYRFSDRKFSQHIITTNDLPQEKGIRNNSASSLFHKLLTNVMRMKILKQLSWNEIHRSLLHLPWPYHFC